MGNCLRQLVVLSSVAAKCRKFWLVAAFVPLSLGLSEPAVAQTCAPVANPGTLGGANPASTTCTGTFNTNINFGGVNTPPPSLLTLTLQQGPPPVIVNSPTGGNAVNLQNTFAPATGVSATINANDATITNTSNPGGNSQSALRIVAAGSATITASGIINMTGGQSTNAIFSTVFSSVGGTVASVTYNGAATPGVTDINVIGGPNSTAIQACANDGCGYAGTTANGDAIINATGNLTGVFGNSGFGLDAVAGGNGTATVNYNGGTINLTGGSFSDGIFATASGSATVTTLPGTTIIVSSTSPGLKGVEAFSGSGATLANVASTIQVTGNPTPAAGDFRFQPAGIQLQSNVGPASVNYAGPGITVQGGGGLGIAAVSGSSGAAAASGSVTVNASGPINITADSSDAVGILADSGTLRNTVRGLAPTLMTGLVQVTASNVSTQGQFGTAISANGGNGGVTVNIPSGVSIMGGWQATAFTVPGTPLLPGTPPSSVTPP